MATRRKTVKFATAALAVVNDATVTNLPQFTIELPEGASIVVQDCYIELGFQDLITATGGTINETRVGVSINGGAYQTVTETDDIANSGENIAGVTGPWRFNSLSWGTWTSGIKTVDIQVYFDHNTGTTLGMRNVSAVMYITYLYNDIAATQLKTVHIPIGGATGALPTTKTILNAGESLAIPQLTGVGGILPEVDPFILDYFFIIEGNENNANTATDWTLSCAAGGLADQSFMVQEAALGTDRFCRWIYKVSIPPTTTAAQAFYLWSSLATRAHHLTVTLVITYSFTLSGTTRLLNSILVPIEIASPLGATAAANASRYVRNISIQDPGTITLRQSAVRLNWNVAATPGNINIRVGSQAYQAYTSTASVVAGMFCLQKRIDANSAGGAAFTLVRGQNEIVIDAYSTNASNEASNINGYLLLNYESDVYSGGVGGNTTTRYQGVHLWEGLLSDKTVFNASATISETNYALIAAGYQAFLFLASGANGVTFDVAALTGEGKELGFYDVYTDTYVSDAERANTITWMSGRDVYKRFPEDANPDRLAITVSRQNRFYSPTTTALGMVMVITYHSMTWTVAGTISGNNAALTTDIKLVRNSTGEIMQEQTLVAGDTTFSFTVYDNTDEYYVSAYQDGTHVGRSAIGTAS